MQARRHAQECGVIEMLFAATYACDAGMCHLHLEQSRPREERVYVPASSSLVYLGMGDDSVVVR